MNSILITVPTERTFGPLMEMSIAIAATFQPRIHVVAAGFEATNVGFATEGGAAVAAVYEIEQERAQARADAALAIFASRAQMAGLPYTSRSFTAAPYEAALSISTLARLYDLNLVMQPEPDVHTFDNIVPEEILLQSGSPVLFVPYVGVKVSKPQRIGIAWDGSRAAARAVRDAMRFIRVASKVEIITINEEVRAEASADALRLHLSKQDVQAQIIRSSAHAPNIQPSLLSIAADESLDLMVMGAYGHSRLRERVLGGVSRAMIKSMTLPTLMSH